MQDIIRELDTLLERYKTKGYKLKREDEELAREKLKALLHDSESAAQGYEYMLDFPENCCKAFLDSWEGSSEEHKDRLIRLLLGQPEGQNNKIVSRKIRLAADFISVDSKIAWPLIYQIATRLSDNGEKVPAPRMASLFWKEMMAPRKLLQIPLQEKEKNINELNSLGIMVFYGLMNCPETDHILKNEYISWLDRHSVRVKPARGMIAALEKVAGDWPEELQRSLQELGFIKTLSYKIQGAQTVGSGCSAAAVPAACTQKIEPGKTENDNEHGSLHRDSSALFTSQTMRHVIVDPAAQLTLDVCLDWVASHVKSLENEHRSLADRLQLLELDARQIKNKNAELEKTRDHLHTLQEDQKRQIQDQSVIVSSLERENKELAVALRKAEVAHEEEREVMRKRIENESAFINMELKNILKERIYPHYSRYLEAKEKPASEGLSRYLEHLLEKVFRELNGQGINWEGE